jgi:hypothetical protein
MASYVKYEVFAGTDLPNKVHDILGTAGSGADTLKVMLSNTAPNVSTHTVRADVSELSTANGYTSGGQSTANAGVASSGTLTVTGTNVTWTASGGSIGPFQYVILYNDTPTSPADPLIAYWNYGSALTLNDGESFTVKFNNGSSSGTMFTLA